MNKFKDFVIEYKKILISLSIFTFAALGIFLFLERPFYVNADQQLQYNIFYEEWMNLLRSFFSTKSLPMYSFNSFLGQDFWASRAFHVIGDPFVILMFILKDIELTLLIETIACIFISGITMNMFLKSFGVKSNNVRNAHAVLYAISGWAILFIGQYMFHRFYAVLPLLFYGFEYYLKNKKSRYLILATFLLFLQNYYFMFPTSIILFLYALFSLNLKGRFQFNEIFRVAKVMIPAFLLGVGLSGVIILPAANFLLQNTRVGVNEVSGLTWNLNVYLGMIMSFIVNPFPVYTEYGNMFYSGTNGHEYWYSLYISILPILGAFALVFDKSRIKNYGLFLFFVIGLLMFKPLASFMHAFSEPTLRWSFLVTFILVMYSALYFDRFYNWKKIKHVAFAYFVGVFMALLGLMIFNYIDFVNHQAHLINVGISLISSAIILWLFHKYKKVAVVFTLFELTLSATFLIYQYNKNYYNYTPSINNEYVSYFASEDNDLMYRMYVNPKNLLPSSSLNLNQNLSYGFMTTTSYDSLYYPTLKPFLHSIGIDWHIIDIQDYTLQNMLGAKYYIVYEESELPAGNFEYVYNLDHLQVYRDTSYRSIGHSYTKYGLLDDDNCEYGSCLRVSDEMLVAQSEAQNRVSNFHFIEKYPNGFYGEILLEEPAILFFSFPYSSGWSAYSEDTSLEIMNVNNGFIGIYLEAGQHYINMNYMTPYLKWGVYLSMFSALCVIVSYIVIKMRRIKYAK